MFSLSTISRTFLAVAVIASAQIGFAADESTSLVVTKTEMALLDKQINLFQDKAKERNAAGDLMASARKTAAGWSVAVDFANDARPYGLTGLIALGPARYAMAGYKELAVAKNLARPTTVALVISGVVYAVGIGSKVAGQRVIQMTDADYANAQLHLATVEAQLAQMGIVISALAEKIPGVVVRNNEITGLPSGLKSLGGGTLLNLDGK